MRRQSTLSCSVSHWFTRRENDFWGCTLAEKHGTYRAVILFSNNKEAGGALLSLVPKERQNKTYKGTANKSGEVEILKVKTGNYDVHVGATKNPDTGEKESHQGPGLSIKGGDNVVQNICLQ
jgi:hypothetical protein